MKFKSLFIALLIGFTACKKTDLEGEKNGQLEMITAEEPQAFTCINAQADNPAALSDAKNWIVGKWQLKGMITMVANVEVPNYEAEFLADGTVTVRLAGEVAFTNAYSLVEESENDYRYLKIITDDMEITEMIGGISTSEHNIVKGGIRICADELMVDQGIAFDAPGYLFRKL